MEYFGFPWCSAREDLSIDVTITNVGLILTKLWWFLFSGCGQTDRQGFWILIWKHVGNTKKISTQSSKLRVSCRLRVMHPRMTRMHNKNTEFISMLMFIIFLWRISIFASFYWKWIKRPRFALWKFSVKNNKTENVMNTTLNIYENLVSH